MTEWNPDTLKEDIIYLVILGYGLSDIIKGIKNTNNDKSWEDKYKELPEEMILEAIEELIEEGRLYYCEDYQLKVIKDAE
jgi:predicted subunit of tRNA(5-methylaminomethyl-2-thiouridylate) methyltransferase